MHLTGNAFLGLVQGSMQIMSLGTLMPRDDLLWRVNFWKSLSRCRLCHMVRLGRASADVTFPCASQHSVRFGAEAYGPNRVRSVLVEVWAAPWLSSLCNGYALAMYWLLLPRWIQSTSGAIAST